MAPQDATAAEIEMLRKELGLDGSLIERYIRYMGNLVKGDLGVSLSMKRPVRKIKKRSLAAEVWRNYKKSPSAMVGLVLITLIILTAVVAQFVFNYDTDIVQQDLTQRFISPCLEHPLGTDQYGRDVLVRILYGAKYSLAVGIVSVFVSCVIGASLGLIAGYYGGVIENVILRICEVFMGIPSVLLGIAIMAAFGQSISYFLQNQK